MHAKLYTSSYECKAKVCGRVIEEEVGEGGGSDGETGGSMEYWEGGNTTWLRLEPGIKNQHEIAN